MNLQLTNAAQGFQFPLLNAIVSLNQPKINSFLDDRWIYPVIF